MSNLKAHKLETDYCNEPAELSVIATCIWNDGLDMVSSLINDPKVFYMPRNRLLFQSCIELKRENVPLDAITVSDRYNKISKRYDIDKELAPDRLTMTYRHKALGTDMEKLKHYSKILISTMLQRVLERKTTELHALSRTSNDPTEMLAHAHHLVNDISTILPSKHATKQENLDKVRKLIFSENPYIPFGIGIYNAFAGGMTRGEFTVLGGRPGHGKTTQIINIGKSIVDKHNLKVMVVNREMSNQQMFFKLAIIESDFTQEEVRKSLTPERRKQFYKEVERVIEKYENRLIMFDNPMDVYTTAGMARQVKPDVIIDDYIQLWSVPGTMHQDRRLQIEEGLKVYKNLCKELDISAILCSQLNRNVEQRFDNPYPQPSDLAEAGTIEQMAENVLFTFYDYKLNHDDSDKGPNCLELVCSKVRNGTSGIYDLGFSGNNCKITDTVEQALKLEAQNV